jgi:hypothetical protein
MQDANWLSIAISLSAALFSLLAVLVSYAAYRRNGPKIRLKLTLKQVDRQSLLGDYGLDYLITARNEGQAAIQIVRYGFKATVTNEGDGQPAGVVTIGYGKVIDGFHEARFTGPAGLLTPVLAGTDAETTVRAFVDLGSGRTILSRPIHVQPTVLCHRYSIDTWTDDRIGVMERTRRTVGALVTMLPVGRDSR